MTRKCWKYDFNEIDEDMTNGVQNGIFAKKSDCSQRLLGFVQVPQFYKIDILVA